MKTRLLATSSIMYSDTSLIPRFLEVFHAIEGDDATNLHHVFASLVL